jgi:formyl-CoA transferase
VWACAVFVQGALSDAAFFPLHDRLKPPNATLNVYRASDDTWFLIVVTPDHWPALAKGIGRPDLLTDARFTDPAKQMANSGELTAILNELFATQPMPHWREVFDQAHLTYGVVHAPSEVVKDPQLRENDIVVPIEGAGEKVKLTVSSPLTVHGVSKVAARRAPEIGEHNDELLQELGFSSDEIAQFRTGGAIPHAAHEAEVSGGVR